MVNLGINIGKLHFKNPVLTASGTFGYGSEFDDFFDVNRLGGIILKGTTMEPREGNMYPRMAETPSGMLNSVGLQNKGIDYFEKHIYPKVSAYETNIIVNVNGNYIEEYVALAERVNKLEKIGAIELNISCPNVKMGGMAFGTNTGFGQRSDQGREIGVFQSTDSQVVSKCHKYPGICQNSRRGGC